jgi:hypothetical protein
MRTIKSFKEKQQFNELFSNFNYKLPQDPELILYDFYFLSQIAQYFPTNDENFNDMIMDAVRESTYALQKHMIQAVKFSLTAEIRHIFDSVYAPNSPNAQKVYKKHDEFVLSYYRNLKAYKAGGGQSLSDLPSFLKSLESQKDLEDFADRIEKSGVYKGNNADRTNSFKAILKTQKDLRLSNIELAEIYEDFYMSGSWNGGYGGPAWGKIAVAWQKLLRAKKLKDVITWIDHAYDLQHNTDTVFNKLQVYYKSGYSWIKNALDWKRDVEDPRAYYNKVSAQLKPIVAYIAKNSFGTTMQAFEPGKKKATSTPQASTSLGVTYKYLEEADSSILSWKYIDGNGKIKTFKQLNAAWWVNLPNLYHDNPTLQKTSKDKLPSLIVTTEMFASVFGNQIVSTLENLIIKNGFVFDSNIPLLLGKDSKPTIKSGKILKYNKNQTDFEIKPWVEIAQTTQQTTAAAQTSTSQVKSPDGGVVHDIKYSTGDGIWKDVKVTDTFYQKVFKQPKGKHVWIKNQDIRNALLHLDEKEDKIVFGPYEGAPDQASFNGWWKNGIWENGIFGINSIWKNGVWKNGLFKGKTWVNGEFYNGTFAGDTWDKGKFYGGEFTMTIWKNGTWFAGKFKDSTWQNGVWWKGIFSNSVWQNGTWHDGTFKNSLWENGKWIDGEFSNKSDWIDGVWKKGYFKGTWLQEEDNTERTPIRELLERFKPKKEKDLYLEEDAVTQSLKTRGWI